MESHIFIPHSVDELYKKMINEKFIGQLSVQKDWLIWNLPNKIIIKIALDCNPLREGCIDTYYFDDKKEYNLTHWHPMEEEVYKDLMEINVGQVFWVKKKKSIFRNPPLIMDKSKWETFSEKKRRKYIIL